MTALASQALVAAPSSERPVAGGLELAVREARDGDVAAFERVYRACIGRVYALCLRLCADRELAETLAQDAFVHAWQKLGSYRAEAAFTTWLHRLTVNVVLQHRRSDMRRRDREQARGELEPTADAPHRRVDAGMDLEGAIARLPERARMVLVLHDMEGYQHQEIARVMDITVGGSKAQLHRARKILREALT